MTCIHTCVNISTITSTQKFNIRHPIIRVNACSLYVFRLRNQKELDAIIEGLSGLYPKETLLQIYEQATSEPYSFWYINLAEKNKKDSFYQNLNKKIVVTG